MSRRFVSIMPSPRPRLASVGVAFPCATYAQETIADLLAVPDGLPRRFFRGTGIDTRHLYLRPTEEGLVPQEDQSQLLARHRRGGLELGRDAVTRCLRPLGLAPEDIDYLCCVSSTGLMMPGLSAMYIRHLGFREDCQRIDIVGMGCNAALNGLNATAAWASTNPGRYAMTVCCEINSAIYVNDDRVVTAVANSLFGDGCGAVLVNTDPPDGVGPELYGFASHVVPEAWRTISYHWSATHNKFELFLDKDIPKLLGQHSPVPIAALLQAFHLCSCDVSHWLVHAGGKKVISAVAEANGLSLQDVRHATNVLRQFGNLGSATVLVSYDELVRCDPVAAGEYGVMVTMGPGATIETALLRW